MTTRRRRTGSETADESTGFQNNLNSSVSNLCTLPQAGSNNVWSNNIGYYKKTDGNLSGNHLSGSAGAYVNNSASFAISSFTVTSDSPLLSMASRDRTQEFARIVRLQQGNNVNFGVNHSKTKSRDLQQYADFMQRSRLIGRNISSTYAKLEKLTHLAKKRTLFDDSHDHEIQELTGIIRHDLSSLTKHLEDLQNRSKLNESVHSGKNGQLQKHSANLVGTLQTKVASITQKFKDVLEVRTENLKKQAERREQFAGGQVSRELPAEAVTGYHQGSVLLADEAASTRSRVNGDMTSHGSIAINMDESGSGALEGAVGGGVYQNQLALMEEQDAYLQSRADTMKTIESTIVELGQMFTHLATMVQEQEELVHRIDANVDHTELNIEAAHTELLKYFKSVSSNRWLMIKGFGILIVFFVIFVLFMT